MALVITGILAVATTMFLVSSAAQSLNTSTTSGPQTQSAFVTTTASVGEATITEILVNTSVQFPIGERAILPLSLSNSVQVYALIVLLCLSLVIGLSLSRDS